jgi:osmotically-inducible protein OsmY
VPSPDAAHHRALLLTGSLLLILPLLSGCIVAAAGAGAAGGYSVFGQEESAGNQIQDKALAAQVSQSWDQHSPALAHDLDATVYESRVLITGRVPTEELHRVAVERAHRVAGVKEVYDEIEVGPESHFMDSARDAVISTTLRNDLLLDSHVRSINYTVKTESGVVYVIGIARSREELERVTNYGRNIARVRRVVSYVRIRAGEVPAAGAEPAASSPPPPPGPEDTPVGTPTPRGAIDVQPLQ